ncbi:hypothetical protein FRC12_020116 [Ceratobasidium sp. 428]|nr:hypothetical protein FRC12_020116 [Ceratobasidium sp. 428]
MSNSISGDGTMSATASGDFTFSGQLSDATGISATGTYTPATAAWSSQNTAVTCPAGTAPTGQEQFTGYCGPDTFNITGTTSQAVITGQIHPGIPNKVPISGTITWGTA